jgi:GT2 family glycosyltransferase
MPADRIQSPPPATIRVGALVVNFNTAGLTLAAAESLAQQHRRVEVVVLDNGSDPQDLESLAAGLRAETHLIRSDTNLGFAAGCNLGLAHLLARPEIDAVMLLNSDAWAHPELVDRMAAEIEAGSGVDLIGAPLHRMDEPSRVDSLGITFYASLIASNRLDASAPFFGPTGGCALYSRRVLEDLEASHGYVFDPDFFCYAEDTDLAARALLLGYRAAFVDSSFALHHGQASSAGSDSSFVLYHGIRNSIWTMVKNVPISTMLIRAPFVAAIHAAIVLRHLRRGRISVVLKLYRDAIRGLPRMLRKRKLIQSRRRVHAREFAARLSPRFYDRVTVREALRDLFGVRASRPQR